MRREIFLLAALFLAGCAARTATAPPRPVPVAPPPVRNVEPSAFIGLSAETLRARLGAPAFTRKDGATDMWRYDSKTCHAYFFFTAAAISHVETIPHNADAAADPACLNALKK